MKIHVIILLLCYLFTSCDKMYAKKIAGNYRCYTHYLYWDGIPTYIDSSYISELKVSQKNKTLTILNFDIHIDSLRNENEYTIGDIHDYLKVQVKKDSIFIVRSSGGLGGNASISYRGKKID